MKRFLLKQKVLLLLTITSIFSLLAVGIFVYIYTHSILVKNKEIEILNIVTEQSHESIAIFKNDMSIVKEIEARIEVVTNEYLLNHSQINKDKFLSIASELIKSDKNYLSVYFLDKNGVVLISTDPRFEGQDYSFDDDYVKRMMGKSIIDIGIDKISNQFAYYFSAPVLGNNGDIVGVLVLRVDPSEVNDSIIASEASKDNVVMLVDEFGVVLYSPEADRLFKSLGVLTDEEKSKLQENNRFNGQEIIPLQYDSVQQDIRGYKGPTFESIYDKVDGDTETLSLIKLTDLSFYLVTEIRLESVNNEVLTTVFTITLITLIILIIISLFIFYFLEKFLKPLDKFKLFFANISKGDFSQEIKIETKDEFSDLAASVDKMSKDLSGLYKNLDEKVKEKTEKLEQSETVIKEALEKAERLNKLMVGRELEMVGLKKELDTLKNKNG